MIPRLSALALALLNVHMVYAGESGPQMDANYRSRITGQFLTGDNQQLGGFADVMFPFVRRSDSIVFADGTLMLGQSQRAAYSGGLGYRGIRHTRFGDGIFGAYVFADYYHSNLKTEQWLANPGLEWLAVNYEARLQGYFPLKRRQQAYARTFASTIPNDVLRDSGRTNNLAGATGHRIFDTPVNLVE